METVAAQSSFTQWSRGSRVWGIAGKVEEKTAGEKRARTPAARVSGRVLEALRFVGELVLESVTVNRELKPQTTSLLLSEVTAAHAFNAVSQVSSQQMARFPFHRQREIRLEGTCRRPRPTSSLHTCHTHAVTFAHSAASRRARHLSSLPTGARSRSLSLPAPTAAWDFSAESSRASSHHCTLLLTSQPFFALTPAWTYTLQDLTTV